MPTLAARALIVDPDVERASNVARRVRDETHLVPDVVRSSEAAEAWLDDKHAALVFVAVDAVPGQMATSEGRSTVRRIFLLHPEATIVALVGHEIGPEEAASVLHAGAADLLEVPVTDAKLGTRLRHLLDAHRKVAETEARVARRLRRAHDALAARRLDAAHAHARRALALDPLLPAAFNVLGVVAQLRLCIEDAQRLYRTALALDDRYGPARANLVNLTGFPKKLSAFDV